MQRMMHRDQERQIFLRPIEAAQALGCSRTRIYELVHSGELPHVLLGGTSIRIPRAAIDEMVAQAMGRPTSASSVSDRS
jgi:excisionase family DNA binding protein